MRIALDIDEGVDPTTVRLDESGAVVERATDRSVGFWEILDNVQ